jgi:lysyl-tRNA synthetase class 2
MNGFRQTSIKNNLKIRASVIQSVRKFFFNNDYLEIETPYRIPAPAPEAHIDAQDSGNWVLHTSPELCMKRLLSAGYPRIFQICRCFRKQERGHLHLPEFTILEWYTAERNYFDMMDQCEDLIRFVARDSGFGNSIEYQTRNIDLKRPWHRLSVSEAFDKYSPISLNTALSNDRFDELMVNDIEPNLGREKPIFLFDYPASTCALAKLKPDNPSLVQRFELYISGLELCNAFTELADPDEQRIRFEGQQDLRRKLDKQTYPIPENFLKSLAFMPEATGNALGIDRLVMLFANAKKIDDVVTFTPEEL